MSWFRIQEMFRFDAFHMYGIIGTAVVTAAISLLMIKRLACETADGTPLGMAPKTVGRGVRYVAGGAVFGLGWALTGSCPGPLVALVGAGLPVMLVTMLSALGGHVDLRETTSEAATLNGRSRKEQSMILQQFYLNCLAHASYLVGDEQSHVAAVVDPQRDIEQYLAFAREHDLRITHVVPDAPARRFPRRSPRAARTGRRRSSASARSDRRVRVHRHARRRCDRLRARAHHGARDPRPHAGVDLAARLRSRPQRHAPACGADRRHAVCRRRRPARPARRARLVGRRRWAACSTTRCTTKLLPLPDDSLVYPAHGAGSLCGKALGQGDVLDDRRAAPRRTTRCSR